MNAIDNLFIHLARISFEWRWPIEIERPTNDDGEPVAHSVTISWGYWTFRRASMGGRHFLELGPLNVTVWEWPKTKVMVVYSWLKWKWGEHYQPPDYIEKYKEYLNLHFAGWQTYKKRLKYRSKCFGPIEIRYMADKQ